MGLGGNGLFSSVHTHKEHAVLAAKREVRAFQAREMKLNSLNVAIDFPDHAPMYFVVEHRTDSVGSDGLGQCFGLAVQCPSNGSKCFNAHDLGVGQFELTHVDAGQSFVEFSDAVKFCCRRFERNGWSNSGVIRLTKQPPMGRLYSTRES